LFPEPHAEAFLPFGQVRIDDMSLRQTDRRSRAHGADRWIVRTKWRPTAWIALGARRDDAPGIVGLEEWLT
jgi:hypothetical protein